VKKTKRNLGVELLRLVAMMMIVVFHCMGHGKALDNFVLLKYFLQAICFVCVNLYALITGYACIGAEHRWHRGILLWLQVVFYAILIGVVSVLIGHGASIKTLLRSLVPITSNLYWYVSSYIMLFCLIPFLNTLLSSLSKREFKKFLLIGFALLNILGWLGDYMEFKPFSTNNGYSPLWLIYLYCVGAYLRVNSADFSACRKRSYVVVYIGCAMTMLISRYLIALLSEKVLGRVLFDRLLWSYLSPAVVIGAVALLLFFANLDIKNGRFIAMLAPCSFGVYLLHDHPITRELIIKNGLSGCAQMPWYQALGCTLAFAFAVFSAGLLIDFLRSKLFALLHIPQFAKWLEEKLKVFARRLIR